MKLLNLGKVLRALTFGAAFICAGFNTTALAQAEAKPASQAPKPQINRAELARLKAALRADETQTLLIDAAYEGYRTAALAVAGPLRAQRLITFTDAGEIDQEALRRQVAAGRAIEDHRLARELLQREFLESVQVLLDEPQEPLWEPYQKGLRRRTTLNQLALLSGEGIDLIELAGTLELAAEQTQALENVLRQYANELDDALSARNDILTKVEAHFQSFDLLANPDGLDQPAHELMARSMRQRLAVVNVNRRFVAQITSVLETSTAAAFQEAFERTCFPQIFQANRADRYIEKLNADAELTPAQRQSSELVVQDYKQNLVPINHKLVELEWQRQTDLRADISRAPEMEEFNPSVLLSSKTLGRNNTILLNPKLTPETRARIHKAQDQKNELINNTMSALFAVLSPEQQERLPKPKPIIRLTGEDLAQFFDDAIGVTFDSLDFPEDLDVAMLAKLLEGVQFDEGNITIGFGQIEGVKNGTTGVFVIINLDTTTAEGGDEAEAGG